MTIAVDFDGTIVTDPAIPALVMKFLLRWKP